LKKRKIIIKFLARFFVTYFVLLAIYNFYLKQTQRTGDVFSCAPMTKMVAFHTYELGKLLGFDTYTGQHESELSMKFFVGDVYASRIVEGCNSISIIILFLAFIIAFSGSLKATVIYGLVGTIIIYIVNLFRILLLSLFMYKYPEYQYFLHNIFFPGVIYGTTFILWIIWVNKFSNLKRKKNE
jgi:exosortase family protein XrtF